MRLIRLHMSRCRQGAGRRHAGSGGVGTRVQLHGRVCA